MPNLKSSRVVNTDFHAQPSESINLIIKSNPSSKNFKPALQCQQSQLTEMLKQMCIKVQRNNSLKKSKKYIKLHNKSKKVETKQEKGST